MYQTADSAKKGNNGELAGEHRKFWTLIIFWLVGIVDAFSW